LSVTFAPTSEPAQLSAGVRALPSARLRSGSSTTGPGGPRAQGIARGAARAQRAEVDLGRRERPSSSRARARASAARALLVDLLRLLAVLATTRTVFWRTSRSRRDEERVLPPCSR
jgi:hypothetical protein